MMFHGTILIDYQLVMNQTDISLKLKKRRKIVLSSALRLKLAIKLQLMLI